MAGNWLPRERDPRTQSNPVGEKATYVEYLGNYRLTLELKCQDLTPEQLATRSVPPSTLSLLGLVRHMARVEHSWFRRVAQSTGEKRLYSENHDAPFDEVEPTQACVDEAFTAWKEQIRLAEEWFESVPESRFGEELAIPDHGGAVVSIRDLIVHMIEEYARHCGHADLLREAIDGRTGQ